jgi:hypothetical protein
MLHEAACDAALKAASSILQSTWCYDVRRHDASGIETKKREELSAPSRQHAW